MEIDRLRFRRRIPDLEARFRIVLGDRGSGKTNFALLLAETYSEAGLRPRLVLPAKVEAEVGGLSVIGFGDRKERKAFLKSLKNSVVVLDEGLLLANARDRQRGFGTDLVKLSAVARHRRLVFVLTTQAHRVDVQIRELADVIVIKKTSLNRLVLLDRPPKRITRIDYALRKRSSALGKPKSLDTLAKSEAVVLGSKAFLVYGIPKSRRIDALSTRAAKREIELRRRRRSLLGSFFSRFRLPKPDSEFFSRQKGSYVTGIRIHMIKAIPLDYRLRFQVRDLLFRERKKRKAARKLASIIALYTGLRRQEIVDLKRDDYDAFGGRLYIRRRKKKSSKSPVATALPVHPELRTVLEERKGKKTVLPSFYILSQKPDPVNPRAISTNFRRRAKRSGLVVRDASGAERYLRFHDLRHLFALRLLNLTKSVEVVRRVLGHRNPKTTLVYLDTLPEDEIRDLLFRLRGGVYDTGFVLLQEGCREDPASALSEP